MGTRHLIEVKSKKKIKVAQYGQWDGYPTGQGKDIANFLKTVKLPRFRNLVNALGVYTTKAIEKAYTDAGAEPNSEFVSMDVAEKVKLAHPALSRDQGAKILSLIYSGAVTKVQLASNFKNDKVFCEYWYLIDLDDETVSMNGGKPVKFTTWTRSGYMQKLEDKESEE